MLEKEENSGSFRKGEEGMEGDGEIGIGDDITLGLVVVVFVVVLEGISIGGETGGVVDKLIGRLEDSSGVSVNSEGRGISSEWENRRVFLGDFFFVTLVGETSILSILIIAS